MKRIDWHAGFVSAMKLEFIDNENDLIFEEEHPVSNRAQRIDLLIIRNDKSVAIHNKIGSLFGRYNICEYKSPEQSLTYGDFYKVLAYTGLYLNETQQGENHNADDYTMTFVREPHPYGLFRRLKADGIDISEMYPGIYRLSNNLPFRTQVIVTKEFPHKEHSWLRCLTRHGTGRELDIIIANTPTLDKYNKRHADNIMDIFTSANNELVRERIKEPAMCNAVNELFADQIEEMKLIIADKESKLTDMESLIAAQASTIAELKAKLAQYTAKDT